MTELPAARPSAHQELILESEHLEERMSKFQDSDEPRPEEIAQVRRDFPAGWS